MTGLVKPKQYDWKDSNLALFGSDTEKNIKKDSAKHEAAWEPVASQTSPTLIIWRIEKFKVVPWPKEDYGKFYSGDSYIVLNIYKLPGDKELKYDVHFWIGKYSTQDEYGTAAYKTVELDTFLDDAAIQHREVQSYESDKFKGYFPVMTIMKGGVATGFRNVKPEEYQRRLMHFQKTGRTASVIEVPAKKSCLNSGDVFILDNGLEAWQWNGKVCNKEEKIAAAQFLQQLESERNGRCKTEVLEEETTESTHKFYKLLSDEPTKRTKKDYAITKALYKLSDESGKMKFTRISDGKAPKSLIDEKDVYIIDNGKRVFVYIGSQASTDEKRNAISHAHNYLSQSDHPFAGVTALKAGQNCSEYESLLD